MSWFDDAKEVDTLTIEGGDGIKRLCEEEDVRGVRWRWKWKWNGRVPGRDGGRRRRRRWTRTDTDTPGSAGQQFPMLGRWPAGARASVEPQSTVHPNPGPVDLRRRSPILALPNASARRPDATRHDETFSH